MDFLKTQQVAVAVENVLPQHPRQRTAIVLGGSSGGTSMVAAVLHGLGVYMGEWSDLRRGGAFENPAMLYAEAETERCNGLYDVWGFKNPKGVSALKSLPESTRNPYGIVIFRDPIAVAQRLLARHPDLHKDRTFADVVEEAASYYEQLRRAVVARPWPRLWISYERAKSDSPFFVRSIIDFLGLKPTTAQTAEAVSRVVGGYLNPPAVCKWTEQTS